MARMFLLIQLLIVTLVTIAPLAAFEAKPYKRPFLPGPFSFEVLEVLDGDTFRARIPVWLDQHVVVKIRLRDIDTPEMNGKCTAEKTLARRAKAFAARWLAQDSLRLVNVSYGTYAGRVLATTQSPDGATLSDALLEAGLAKPYRGRKADWCV